MKLEVLIHVLARIRKAYGIPMRYEKSILIVCSDHVITDLTSRGRQAGNARL